MAVRGEEQQMDLDVTLERGVVVVAVAGRVDCTVVSEFEARVRPFFHVEEIRGLILDFADLTYLSSGGLRVILMAARALKSRSAGFAICAAPHPVRTVLNDTGFAQVRNIHASRRSALDALSADGS